MEPNKTKSILSIFLTVLMMLGFSGLALAAHTTSYSEVPEWAQGAATETYTWTVTNNGPDNIDKVYITIPTGFGLVDCSASLPVNWNTLTSPPTGVTCAYQSQNPANDIMSGCFKDFGIDVSTPGTTGTTYQWRLYSSDVNGAFSATIDINTKVDADAPSISAISVTDGTNTATTLDGSEYLLDADAIVSFTVEDPASGIASVKVFYDVNGAATVADTALAVTDLGSGNYEATIPGTAFGDTDVVHFIVVAEDNVGNVATTADKSFIIDGVVDLVDNGGPYSYNEGDDFTFDGSGSSDLNGIVSYEWLIAAIPSATGVNPTLTWAEFIALSPSFGNDGSFVLLLRVTDGVGNVDTHSNTLTINNTAPTVEVTSPNGGEEWAGTHDITWTATDPSPQDEAALTFDINGSDDDGATYDVVIATGVSGNSYSWDTKTVTDDDDWMIKVVAHDDDTTSEDVSDADFMVDNTAPVIDTTGSDSSINEGDNLLVVLTSSHDNDPPGSGIATVEFDLDNDGVYDTAPTAWGTPFATSFAWVSLVSKGMGDDGTNYAITIRLTDKVGNQKEGDLLFDIVNVAPTTTAGS
ncbi:hypothetical protein JXB31_05275, partial [Candidatus Woesearchaeota archaeon]|nr:hypothetical protein [Candidatus Woesearchaeota archaeon]